MSHERFSELCPIYAVGALDGEDLYQLESHLEGGCPTCQEQIQEYTELTTLLPGTLPNVPLSPDLKGRLMARIEKESSDGRIVDSHSPRQIPTAEAPPRTSTWLPWTLAAAAGLALAVSLWSISNLNTKLSEQQARLNQQQEQARELQNQLDQEKTVTAFLSNPEVRVTMLAGTAKSPQASGKILWNPEEKKALFYAANLPAPPTGKTYQLWVITDKPVDAGIFSVDQAGNGFLKINSLAQVDKAQKFAVTLEPAGGMPQPTGEMHLLGSL